jgi:spermidine/putrescine transport system permease protein
MSDAAVSEVVTVGGSPARAAKVPAARTRRGGWPLSDRLLAGWTALVLLFLFSPLVVIVVFSVNDSAISNLPMKGFTTKWYAQLLTDEPLQQALLNTLKVAFVAVILGPTLGTLAAVGINRYTVRLRSALNSLVMLPIMIPRLILGIALLNCYTFFNIDLSLVTVIFGHVVITMPFVIMIVTARLLGFDKHLEEAALDLGASRWIVFKEITLPLLKPAIIGGALISFTLSFDDVVVALFTTGTENTLPMYIWAMLSFGISPKLNALATITLLVSMAVAFTAEMMIRRADAFVGKGWA